MRATRFSIVFFLIAIFTSVNNSNAQSCNCWIEPDFTYTTSFPETNNGWDCEGGAGDGVDCWLPIELPFDFCFYGNTYNQISITTKGTIAMGAGYHDWTASEFPVPTDITEPQHDHICGFWADSDLTETGNIFYKITEDAFYLNYVDIGYFDSHTDKTNTFQIIITSENSGLFEDGNNVQFCYKDMQWAHGDVGGENGCCGPTPATVGADKSSGNSHAQFGRFNQLGELYNGPYGQANNQVDGVHWLNNKSLEFSTCAVNSNLDPILVQPQSCDTIFVCLGDSVELGAQFLAPEVGQLVQINWNETEGLIANSQNGNTATFYGYFVGTEENLGTNVIEITATDDGVPVGETLLTYIIQVQNMALPELIISGETVICAGGSTLLTASTGFDVYEWSESECEGNECLATSAGMVSVTGWLGECIAESSIGIFENPLIYLPLNPSHQILCEYETAEFCCDFAENYASFQWSIVPDYCGSIVGSSALPCIEVGGSCEGVYQLIATDQMGCDHIGIVSTGMAYTPPDIQSETIICDELSDFVFEADNGNFDDCFLTLYCSSTNPDDWAGSYFIVAITPCDPDNPPYEEIIACTDFFEFWTISIDDCAMITIEFITSGPNEFVVWIFNNSNEDPIILGPGLPDGVVWEGDVNCDSDVICGDWQAYGPPGWSMTDSNQYASTFTPGGFGEYDLYFTPCICPDSYAHYELEYNLTPSITINPNYDILLCDDETIEICTQTQNEAFDLEYDWSGSGVDPVFFGECALAGPYSDYLETQVSVAVSNACGSDEESFMLTAQPLLPALSIQQELNILSTFLCPCVYQWSLNGEEIIGADSSWIEISEEGSYSVQLTNLCDEAETAPAFYAPVGLENIEENIFSIFPNPFDAEFEIHFPYASEFEIQIFDACGRVVIEKIMTGKMCRISPVDLATGIYGLRVTDLSDNKNWQRWLVKDLPK